MIMAALLYQQPLPDKCQSSLEKRYALKNKDKVQLWGEHSTVVNDVLCV